MKAQDGAYYAYWPHSPSGDQCVSEDEAAQHLHRYETEIPKRVATIFNNFGFTIKSTYEVFNLMNCGFKRMPALEQHDIENEIQRMTDVEDSGARECWLGKSERGDQ